MVYVKTQSLISLGVPALQVLLILSIAFIAVTKNETAHQQLEKKNEQPENF